MPASNPAIRTLALALPSSRRRKNLRKLSVLCGNVTFQYRLRQWLEHRLKNETDGTSEEQVKPVRKQKRHRCEVVTNKQSHTCSLPKKKKGAETETKHCWTEIYQKSLYMWQYRSTTKHINVKLHWTHEQPVDSCFSSLTKALNLLAPMFHPMHALRPSEILRTPTLFAGLVLQSSAMSRLSTNVKRACEY